MSAAAEKSPFEKSLIIITGGAGAGKSTLTQALVEHDGFDRRTVSDKLIQDYREIHGLAADAPINKLVLGGLHKQLHRKEPRRYMDYCLEGFDQITGPGRILDGMRNFPDALGLIVVHNAFVIALDAPQEMRRARHNALLGIEGPEADAAFDAREQNDSDDADEHGVHLNRVMSLAGHQLGITIDAAQPPEDVYREVKTLLLDTGRMHL